MTAVGFSIIFPFLPLYIKELGASSNLGIEFLAGLVFSGQAFTMMIAAPIWGTLADRYGRKIMVERALFGGAAQECPGICSGYKTELVGTMAEPADCPVGYARLGPGSRYVDKATGEECGGHCCIPATT